MKITLNLSTPRSFRERYALAWAVPVAVLGLAGMVACLVAAFQAARDYRRYHAGVVKLEVQESALRASEAALKNEFERPESRQVVRESQYLNSLIDRKRFSVTEFVEKVTKLLPASARLNGLAMTAPGADPLVRFSVVGQSEDAIETFLTNLEDSPDFREVAIISQGLQQQGPGGGPVSIDCTARYVGGRQL
jgi:Tfp pilus assembly protein PilN